LQNYKLLDAIKSPSDIKGYTISELDILSDEMRSFLISSVSKTGGHIGTALGVVELTIAMHYVFNMPDDKIIFDTGHQGYPHKLLTGRKEKFSSLNEINGMSRFLSREESEYDLIDASHAGTAISIAIGMSLVEKGSENYVIPVVGDGALVEGMSMEGLNYGIEKKLPLIIVINDNGMAIPPNVGGISNLFSGNDSIEKSKGYFNGLGYNYLGTTKGHDINELVDLFNKSKTLTKNKPTIVHIKTVKGKGLEIAKTHPYKMHFSMPFNPNTGEGASATPTGKTYSVVAGNKLYSLLEKGAEFTIITPSTPYASGLEKCLSDFPNDTIDVGMAEQHALGMACGLSLAGKSVILCYQSTFMQRAMDQIIHDLCFMNLSVTIIAARSGFAGLDNHTHHGIYDISYLRGIPNLKIFYPGSSRDLEEMIEFRVQNAKDPMIILHPYEEIRSNETEYYNTDCSLDDMEILNDGVDGYFFSVGNTLHTAINANKLLSEEGVKFGIANARWLKPLPVKQISNIFNKVERVITTEENVLDGGYGSSIAEFLIDTNSSISLLRNGIDSSFVRPGSKDYLEKETKIDAKSLVGKIKVKWPGLFK